MNKFMKSKFYWHSPRALFLYAGIQTLFFWEASRKQFTFFSGQSRERETPKKSIERNEKSLFLFLCPNFQQYYKFSSRHTKCKHNSIFSLKLTLPLLAFEEKIHKNFALILNKQRSSGGGWCDDDEKIGETKNYFFRNCFSFTFLSLNLVW